MSFSGMQSNNSLMKRQHEGNGVGFVFGLSLAATVSILMKWWWDHVLNRRFKGRPALNYRSNDDNSNVSQQKTYAGAKTEGSDKLRSGYQSQKNDDALSFEEAASRIRQATFEISTTDKLLLYGLYKQVTKGDAPAFFLSLSFQEQSKHHAWAQFREMPKEVASEQYIKQASDILKNGGSISKSPSFGVGVSSRPTEPEPVKEDDMTPEQRVLVAAGADNVDTLRVLLEGGVSVDQRDEGGQSALHMAADAGALDAVGLLLQYGANVLASDQYGISVLQAAVIAGHVPVCKILLEHGADPDQPDQDGDTPRNCAEDDGGQDMQQLFKSRASAKERATMENLNEDDEEDED